MRCTAVTKAQQACKMPPLDGRDVCFVHATELEPERRRARAAGGAARRRQLDRATGRVKRLDAGPHWRFARREDAIAALADTARGIAQGTLGARDANALVAALVALRDELPPRRGSEKLGHVHGATIAAALEAEEGDARGAGGEEGHLAVTRAAREIAALYGAGPESEALAELVAQLETVEERLEDDPRERGATGSRRRSTVRSPPRWPLRGNARTRATTPAPRRCATSRGRSCHLTGPRRCHLARANRTLPQARPPPAGGNSRASAPAPRNRAAPRRVPILVALTPRLRGTRAPRVRPGR